MTADLGARTAQGFLDRHEQGASGHDHDVDVANNRVGVSIGRHVSGRSNVESMCNIYFAYGYLNITGG